MFFHMARVFLFGAYKYPRELNWIIGVLLLVLGMLEGFTGYLLPCDQTAYWATVVGINLNGDGAVPRPVPRPVPPGRRRTSAPDTLAKFYAIHMLLVPGAIIGLITLHLYLVDAPRRHVAALVGRPPPAATASPSRPGRPRRPRPSGGARNGEAN